MEYTSIRRTILGCFSSFNWIDSFSNSLQLSMSMCKSNANRHNCCIHRIGRHCCWNLVKIGKVQG